MNSASAILTYNVDHHFVPFRPEGSRSMHFKLSFQHPSFDTAFREYEMWQDNLATYDWPCHFDVQARKKKSIMSIESLVEQLDVPYATEFDEFIANKRRQERIKKTKSLQCEPLPTSWQDLIYLVGDRVFSKRYLPKNTPLGFYFGVPMTLDEFDALKLNTAQCAYMYRDTVIDPTDKHGDLYHNICPFYNVKQTGIPDKANVVFYEGDQVNQIVCWTKQDIPPHQELFLFSHELHTPYSWKPSVQDNHYPLDEGFEPEINK